MRKILPWLVAVLSVLIAGMVSFWALQERQSAMEELKRIQASGEQPKSAGQTGDEQIRRQQEELSLAHQRELERLRDSYERALRASVEAQAQAQAQAKAEPTLKASSSGRDRETRVAELARNVEELKRLQTASVSGAVPATAPSSAASSVPQRPAVALRPGKVAWNTPPTMTLGQTAEVELRITLEPERFKDIERRIRASGATTSEEVELAPDLTAKLESTAFDIKPDGAQRQRAREGRDAVWSWVIGPRLRGEHKLLLTITSNVEGSASIEPLVRTIQVTAAPGEALDEAKGFVAKNWDKLLTLILIPIAMWGWRTYRQRRSRSAVPPLPPVPPPI